VAWFLFVFRSARCFGGSVLVDASSPRPHGAGRPRKSARYRKRARPRKNDNELRIKYQGPIPASPAGRRWSSWWVVVVVKRRRRRARPSFVCARARVNPICVGATLTARPGPSCKIRARAHISLGTRVVRANCCLRHTMLASSRAQADADTDADDDDRDDTLDATTANTNSAGNTTRTAATTASAPG
jgi:hypothetical protein